MVQNPEALPAKQSQMVSANAPEILIAPSKGWVSLGLSELWEYRELVYFLVWRDIKVRYKQTVLGATWAVIQPFMAMVVFSIFFGGFAQVPSDDLPYPIWNYAAMVPWQLAQRNGRQSGEW